MGDFRKKIILQTDFEGKKNLVRKNLAKKIPTLYKKLSFMGDKAEKKSYTVVCQERNSIARGLGKYSFPNQITHTTPPSKVKWLTPKVVHTCCPRAKI